MTGKDPCKTIKFEVTVDFSETPKFHMRVDLSKIINFKTIVFIISEIWS